MIHQGFSVASKNKWISSLTVPFVKPLLEIIQIGIRLVSGRIDRLWQINQQTANLGLSFIDARSQASRRDLAWARAV